MYANPNSVESTWLELKYENSALNRSSRVSASSQI